MPLRGRLAGLALCLLAGASAPALAQEVTLQPSAAVRCLTPVAERRGEPEYPFADYKLGKRGRVKVQMRFNTAAGSPEVTVLESDGGDAFVDAVKAHVREFRVPCMGADEAPVTLTQIYVFRPDERKVHWSLPLDSDDDVRRGLLACVRHESGDKAPDYPVAARRSETQGRVLALLRFDAADRPPTVQVMARPSASVLAREVEAWVKGYRMPCHAGSPVEALRTFFFRLGDDTYGFKPLTLLSLLGSVRGIRQQTVQFDFTTMACPFVLKFDYRRPYLPNAVGEVGTSEPARRALLDWLAGVELDLSASTLDSVFGDTAVVTVPCMKIDLKPKE